MFNLLYYTATEMDPERPNGVARKILAQCRAFGQLNGGGSVYLVSRLGEQVLLRNMARPEEEPLVLPQNPACRTIKTRRASALAAALPFLEEHDVRALYFRSTGLGLASDDFLRGAKELGVTTVLEVPTYPFWGELLGHAWAETRHRPSAAPGAFGDVADYWLETFRLKDRVAAVATYAHPKRLWGLPVIPLSNGYDFSSVEVTEKSGGSDAVTLVVAATLRDNHGIDRALRGLAAYQATEPQIPVRLLIAGKGDAEDSLKALTRELGLDESVVRFLGFLDPGGLKDLYAQADAGLSALAFHRYGVTDCSPLKSKEYLANGIPVVGTDAEHDMEAPDVAPYYLTVPSTDGPLDITAVVDFVQEQRAQGVDRETVREASARVFDWTHIMAPVAELYERRAQS